MKIHHIHVILVQEDKNLDFCPPVPKLREYDGFSKDFKNKTKGRGKILNNLNRPQKKQNASKMSKKPCFFGKSKFFFFTTKTQLSGFIVHFLINILINQITNSINLIVS